MELLNVESSRLVSLMKVLPPEVGQPFLPDVITSVAERYRFQKFPVGFDQLLADAKMFAMGVWNGIQIDELAVYNDGIIVGARAPTKFLDDLCSDLIELISSRFGLNMVPASEQRHYESAVVIRLDQSISKKLSFLDVINSDLAAFQENYGLGTHDFGFASIETGVDMTKGSGKRPLTFSIVRRANVSFEDCVWFSAAPLKTDDHVALLENLERIMLA